MACGASVRYYFLCFLALSIKDTFAEQGHNHYGLHPGHTVSSSRSHTARNHQSPAPLRRNSESSPPPDIAPDAQRYFPAFSQLFEDGPPSFVNARPPASFYDDSVFRPSFRTHDFGGNSFGNHREQRESFRPPPAASSKDLGMLGSGNFGVIRGGTYYSEDRDSEREYALDSDLLPFYDGNGHGRPPYFRGNPKPLYKNGGNFFENFRDFAEITPPKSFSENYHVYVSQNASRNASEARILGPEDGDAIPLDEYMEPGASSVKRGPKNILEQLAMIDESKAREQEAEIKSKSRRKLNDFKRKEAAKESRLKAKILATPKNPYDPLMALS